MNHCLPLKSDKKILALGPESAGNFSVSVGESFYLSETFGDLLADDNFLNFKNSLTSYLEMNELRPDIVLIDLHPGYVTSSHGYELARDYQAEIFTVQHHLAHIFSAVGDQIIEKKRIPEHFLGIASDGTGLGEDGLIWGGEVFEISLVPSKTLIARKGHLENQVLIGGDLAVKEPARMLVSILSKILSREEVYEYVKNFYPRNIFNLLTNQFDQRFNCFETSSTGRILDAAAILLGFCDNVSHYKHQSIELLEKNSTSPFQLKPLVLEKKGMLELQTGFLFEFLIKNFHEDHGRLAATAQSYLAQGLYEIARLSGVGLPLFMAGGMANNRLIAEFMSDKGVHLSKKIPRGDAGISFGQIVYYLLANSRN